MRFLAIILPTVISLFTLASIFIVNDLNFTVPAHKKASENQSIAVVELFTSEGCSSCPAADRLLSEIVSNAEKDHQPVYGLSFHVSYWNHLGWQDKFSSDVYTERQKNYAQILKNNQVYTPQMIVNGSQVFVGSNREKATNAIQEALRQPAKSSIQLDLLHTNQSDSVLVKYRLEGNNPGNLLQIALVESNLETQVLRGENRGRLLHHDDVVRFFKSLKTGDKVSGNVYLPVSSDIHTQYTRLIAYLQSPATMEIEGATSVKLLPLPMQNQKQR